MTNVKHITTDEFNSEVLASVTPVLMDFYATWCPPCKMLTPILDELAREYGGRVTPAIPTSRLRSMLKTKITTRSACRHCGGWVNRFSGSTDRGGSDMESRSMQASLRMRWTSD